MRMGAARPLAGKEQIQKEGGQGGESRRWIMIMREGDCKNGCQDGGGKEDVASWAVDEGRRGCRSDDRVGW